MTESSSAFAKIKQFLWPKEPQKRATMKKYYKSIGLFAASTVVLIKFGREIADQVYNRTLIEEAIKASLN